MLREKEKEELEKNNIIPNRKTPGGIFSPGIFYATPSATRGGVRRIF